MGAEEDRKNLLEGEPDAHSVWAIWVAESLTKDADTLLRWSRTSFFAGCSKPEPVIFDGKECSLFMRSSDREFAMERVEVARMYYKEVRMTCNGKEIDLETQSKEIPRPPADLLGGGSSLCGG
jgi:hypothetical protein